MSIYNKKLRLRKLQCNHDYSSLGEESVSGPNILSYKMKKIKGINTLTDELIKNPFVVSCLIENFKCGNCNNLTFKFREKL